MIVNIMARKMKFCQQLDTFRWHVRSIDLQIFNMLKLAVAIRTPPSVISVNSTFCPHSVFMFFRMILM